MRRSVGASGSAATFLHTAAAGKAVALPPWSVRWVAYRNRDYWEPLFDLDVSDSERADWPMRAGVWGVHARVQQGDGSLELQHT